MHEWRVQQFNAKRTIQNTDLLNTELCAKWLQQFEPSFRARAENMISQLVLVSSDEFRNKLLSEIKTLAETLEEPIAMFSSRETEEGEQYFPTEGSVQAVMGGEVGSEGIVAQLVTSLHRSYPGKYWAHPTLAEMRENRVRNIIVVDDVVASGTRAVKFVRRLLENKTIRSWLSLGLLRGVYICAYSAMQKGHSFVNSELFSSKGLLHQRGELRFARPAPSLSDKVVDPHKKNIYRGIIELCTRYKKRGRKKDRNYLGYKDSGMLMVFSHSCSNNSPSLLWSHAGGWNPLFPNRVVPPELLGVFSTSSSRNEIRTLQEVRLLFTKERSWRQYIVAPSLYDMLMLTKAIALGIRKKTSLCARLDISPARLSVLTESALRNGFIERGDHGLAVTHQGTVEVKDFVAAHQMLEHDSEPAINESFYFPKMR